MNKVYVIQRSWRSFKCRKTIKVFSRLPDDLWQLILEIIHKNNQKFSVMERLLFKKLILFTWSIPKVNIESKLKLINFVSKNSLYFEKKIIDQCLQLCKRLLIFCTGKMKLCYINSCVELIVSNRYTM